MTSLIRKERGELNILEKEVVDSISKHEILSENIEIDIEKKLSFSQRIADNIQNLSEVEHSFYFFLFS